MIMGKRSAGPVCEVLVRPSGPGGETSMVLLFALLTALACGGAGVSLEDVQGGQVPYVWRASGNLTRMATIAADGFLRLAPEDADTVRANLERFSASLRRETVAAVPCAWEPGPELSRAIRKGNAAVVVFSPFRSADGADSLQSLADWYEENLSRLAAGPNR